MLEFINHQLRDYKPRSIEEKTSYAVLLPLIKIKEDWHILYQIRSQLVPQPGEVSFPGGRIELGENSRQAAIRETCEELNLNHQAIDILGEIDYLAKGKRTIYCFIGHLKVEDWTQILPNEEVERLFTVPLADLMTTDPSYYWLSSHHEPSPDFPFERIPNGDRYPFQINKHRVPFYDDLTENIWGITALFTHRFIQIIRQDQV